jgi:hypothetical protein
VIELIDDIKELNDKNNDLKTIISEQETKLVEFDKITEYNNILNVN